MSEWIDCDDRQPDEMGEYLVYINSKVKWFIYSSSTGWLWREGLYEGKVSHWMNLPTPPEIK